MVNSHSSWSSSRESLPLKILASKDLNIPKHSPKGHRVLELHGDFGEAWPLTLRSSVLVTKMDRVGLEGALSPFQGESL